MPAPALNAGATRLVSHVPGAATTRGGANHAKQQQTHNHNHQLAFGLDQHGPGATALNAAGHAGASGRFDRLKEFSRDVAFLATEFDVQDVRGKLQRLSRYGGSLSSPVLSAGTLLRQG